MVGSSVVRQLSGEKYNVTHLLEKKQIYFPIKKQKILLIKTFLM